MWNMVIGGLALICVFCEMLSNVGHVKLDVSTKILMIVISRDVHMNQNT